MATCTLIFEDTMDGEVTADIRFDPPLAGGEAPLLTTGQQLGMRMLAAASQAQTEIEAEEVQGDEKTLINKGGYLLEQCRMCGEVTYSAGVPILWLALLNVTDAVPLPEEWQAPYPQISLFGQHACADGRLGITDVVGGQPYDWTHSE